MNTLELFTDGGARNTRASCAVIIKEYQKIVYKLFFILGNTSTSDAEILGGLLGLLVIKNRFPTLGGLTWACDSKTTLELLSKQTSSKYAQALCATASSLVVETQHIPSHSGHKENEACDRACCWAIQSGDKLLRKNGEGLQGRMKTINPSAAWFLFDLRNILHISANFPEEEILKKFEMLPRKD